MAAEEDAERAPLIAASVPEAALRPLEVSAPDGKLPETESDAETLDEEAPRYWTSIWTLVIAVNIVRVFFELAANNERKQDPLHKLLDDELQSSAFYYNETQLGPLTWNASKELNMTQSWPMQLPSDVHADEMSEKPQTGNRTAGSYDIAGFGAKSSEHSASDAKGQALGFTMPPPLTEPLTVESVIRSMHHPINYGRKLLSKPAYMPAAHYSAGDRTQNEDHASAKSAFLIYESGTGIMLVLALLWLIYATTARKAATAN